MNLVSWVRCAVFPALMCASAISHGAPAHHVCVPAAVGVPTRPGPPQWLDWGSGTIVDDKLDDPRWLGAAGQSFHQGSARAPLHARALWSRTPSQNYLYLSFIVDLEGISGGDAASPRDLFLGFRRSTPFTDPDTGDVEHAYIFQFHLKAGAVGPLVAPTHCKESSECDDNSSTSRDYWRVFVDRNQSGTCAASGATGEMFLPFIDNGNPPITWMTNAATPGTDAVRFWKLDASQPPLLQNRWAVQLRLPIASASGLPLQAGIDPASTFWYQASASITGSAFAYLGAWPREVTDSVCPNLGAVNALIHPQLGNPDNYSRLSRVDGARPPDCDAGITINTANVGAMFEAPPGTNFASVIPTTSFKGLKPNGTPGTNTVIAQAVNTGDAAITAPLMARFRLASWGSAPWTPGDTGKWKDMRGAENGVCAAGAPPGCAEVTIQPGQRGAITFPWTIGNDPALGASEYCKFGLTPPNGACTDCSCTGQPKCDVGTDPGTKAASGPCVSKNYQHQCMLVELSAPNGGVEFVQQSAWNNMNFDQMSIVAREALIDARQLPVGKGQRYQDIYLIAMARNMPAAIAGGKTDGVAFLRERTLARAEVAADAYVKDVEAGPGCQVCTEAEKARRARLFERRVPRAGSISCGASVVGRAEGDRTFCERWERVERALLIMPPADERRISGLLELAITDANARDLTQKIVERAGAEDAADIAPTLEIYPFYQPDGKGAAYLPMTAFTVFLSHEGALSGMNWAIDGATKVGRNIYHMRIPVRHAQRIRVRAEAIEGGTSVLDPGNPRWPCAAGCCGPKSCGVVGQLGNALPGLLAGLYAVGRRRRRARSLLSPRW